MPRKKKEKPELRLVYHDDDHAYWLNGKRIKGASGVGKIADDTYRLELYDQRNVLLGCVADRKLLEQAYRVVNDPTIIDERQRNDVLDAIVRAAKKAAGAEDKADLGTLKHWILEQHDKGLLDPDETTWDPMTTQVVTEWRRVLDEYELEVVAVEIMIVHPDLGLAGRLDRILRHRPTGKLRIGDLKFGRWAVRYPHSMTVQLATYASAPLQAGELVETAPGVVECERFEPMPDIDQELAYVFHMPEEVGEIYGVNIAKGVKMLKGAIVDIWDWRDSEDLILIQVPTASSVYTRPGSLAEQAPTEAQVREAEVLAELGLEVDPFDGLTEPAPPTLTVVGEQARQENALEAMGNVIDLDARRAHPSNVPPVLVHPAATVSAAELDAVDRDAPLTLEQMAEIARKTTVGTVEVIGDTTLEMVREVFGDDVEVVIDDPFLARLAWLRDDLLFVKAESEAAFADIAAAWPDDIPTFPEYDDGVPMTMEHLDRLAEIFRAARERHGVGFGPTEPAPVVMGSPAVERFLAPPAEIPPLATRAFDDRTMATKEEIEQLRSVLAELVNFGDAYQTLDGWAAEAHQYGRSFAPADVPSARRVAIMWAITHFLLCTADGGLEPGDLDEFAVMVRTVMGVPQNAYDDYPLPVLLGCLTTDEADQLRRLVDAFLEPTPDT